MIVLGVSGGPEPVYDHTFFSTATLHDAAAVLVKDGTVIAAAEEERLNRIKHTNKTPVGAIRYCLASAQMKLSELDMVALHGDETFYNDVWRRQLMRGPEGRLTGSIRELFHTRFQNDLDDDINDAKLTFVPHHLGHAVSAVVPSGFDRALVVTLDGVGDGIAGMVMDARPEGLHLLRTLSARQSLGLFYTSVSNFIGFTQFEEYKVMGLAPYGDPSRFRELFGKLYTLGNGGDYELRRASLPLLLDVAHPRRRHEPIEQVHMDIAAALQETLERLTFHLLSHYRAETGHRHLCMAGGVAHNCAMNGKLLRSQLFEKVYVQPASHDAGCALGAALYPFVGDGRCREQAGRHFAHVFWGPDLGGTADIGGALERWRRVITFERVADPARFAAQRLANGAIIGWAQGRSEFGPRALGARSIIADPRPPQNKAIINALVKKREAFRPFAPAVTEEAAEEFFELPETHRSSPFMLFAVLVRPEKRQQLGAVTHVDGTARVQTVSRETNERFWTLITAFGELTGVPVVLNTSFNSNAEPIVDSVEDAITCLLTTGLDELFVDDYYITKRPQETDALVLMAPSLPKHMQLLRTKRWISQTTEIKTAEIRSNDPRQEAIVISRAAAELLTRADGTKSIGELADGRADEQLLRELFTLWMSRLICLRPSLCASEPPRRHEDSEHARNDRCVGLPSSAVS